MSFGTNRHQLEKGGGATPFPLLDLEVRDANSIPPTNLIDVQSGEILYRTFLRHSLHLGPKGLCKDCRVFSCKSIYPRS